MTSIDDLFKKPDAAAAKRKVDFASPADAQKVYKSAKLFSNGSPLTDGHASTVEDELLEAEGIEAGPTLQPTGEDEDIPEDDEGRFFGGGINKQEKEVLDFIDTRDGEGAEVIDIPWLRKRALNFEKRISRNAELRAKFEGEPTKFMASEADLDEDIKALSILSEHTDLYEEFVKLGCLGSLVSLLAHENTDIAIDAIEVLGELTDEDVEAEESQWRSLVDAMLHLDVIDLLTQNLARLDETNESDRTGVYHVLSVLENLASQPDVAERIGQKSSMLEWLLRRVQTREGKVGQNKQYAAEILAILLQSSSKNRTRFAGMEGMDAVLQLLSAYRKRDPEKDSDEEEYVENLFDCLVCLVDEGTGKEKFFDAEGVELCQIMLREGKMSKVRALRVLDHALGGASGTAACERFVEAAGLKTIFGMFMKKHEKETIEHLLGIFSSLLRLLPGGSAGRIRTLAKFVEKDYEKIGKLVQLRKDYAGRLARVDLEIKQEGNSISFEEKEAIVGEWLSRRFDAGLFSLQTIDVILAWLAAEDDGARKSLIEMVGGDAGDLSVLGTSLEEQLDGIGDAAGEGESSMKEMLTALLVCMKSTL